MTLTVEETHTILTIIDGGFDVVIYHASCRDGFAAAWAAWLRWPDATYLPYRYEDPPPLSIVKGKRVLVVDFSFKREVLEELHSRAAALVVLDHHKGAEEELKGLPYCIFDQRRSGAGMAWDYLHPLKMRPWVIDYVEDRDLWRWSLQNSRAVSAALTLWPDDMQFWSAQGQDDANQAETVRMGHTILEYEKVLVERATRMAFMANVAGYDVPMVNATALVSEIGNELAKGHPFAVVYYDDEGGRNYSLRSEPGAVDVSEVAALFGGGGHAHAAGFKRLAAPGFAAAGLETPY